MDKQSSADNRILYFVNKITSGESLERSESLYLTETPDLWAILSGANRIREYYKGKTIGLCSIINAKSGDCSEDCAFCAQSMHHASKIKTYPLVNYNRIKSAYQRAQTNGAQGFSIVTSGNELSDAEIDNLCRIIKRLNHKPDSPYLCTSLGKLSARSLTQLKKAGLTRCHHNLETAPRFFPQVCSTHSYEERCQTIRLIKQAGLNLCCGGIFGLGETWADRIDLAFALKELDVDSIPLNFLIPIKGTPLEGVTLLTPLEILRITALFRYILPQKDIRICAGREKGLRDLQSWVFYAGANGMMIGGYLTQPGRGVTEDLAMLKDLGLTANEKRSVKDKERRAKNHPKLYAQRSMLERSN